MKNKQVLEKNLKIKTNQVKQERTNNEDSISIEIDRAITIKEYPKEERPMEKLSSRGVQALSDEELLAIIIGTGTREKNAIELAESLLRNMRERPWLLKATIEDLQAMPGIGLAKACRIVAGLQLGKRLTEQRNFQAISLNNPKTVANYFSAVYLTEDREMFCCVLLDTKNRPIANHIVSIGTLNTTLVHPREVFRPAIRASANAIILSHNHPSGDPEPSKEDILITKRLVEVGEIVGINVLDHVIVGDKNFVSLKQENLM